MSSLKDQNVFTPLATRIFGNIYDVLNDKFPHFQVDPMLVVAGHLGIDENRNRGGSPRSRHLVGEAIDVQLSQNTDDRKCVLATVAEYVFMKEDIGSEIAVHWGLGGHVHIAVIPYKGVHKRFPVGGGEKWTSCTNRNILAVKKAIKKYAIGKTEMTSQNTLDIESLSGSKYHEEYVAIQDDIIRLNLNGDTEQWKYQFVVTNLPDIEKKLKNLNTSPVINWELHRAIDNAYIW